MRMPMKPARSRLAAWGVTGLLGVAAVAGVASGAVLPGSGGSSGSGGSDAASAASLTRELALTAAEDPAASTDPATAAGSAADPAAGGPVRARQRLHLAGTLRRVEHGEVVVATKNGARTVDVQRGTVTAAGATSLTVRSRDGFSQTWRITATTRIRKDRHRVGATVLKVGDRVGVAGPRTGGPLSASLVVVTAGAADRTG